MNEIVNKAQAISSAASDTSDFSIAYDELLWAVVTASAKELHDAGNKIYEAPLLDIPRPLQVAILRLAALTASEDVTKQNLLDLLASLCDPFDEAVIVSPLRGKVE